MYLPPGGVYTMFLGSFTTMADVNPDKGHRVFWITVIATLMTCDSAVFSIVAGYLVDSVGFPAPLGLCAGLAALSCLVAIFLFPETCPMPAKKEINLLGNVKRISGFFFTQGTTKKKVTLFIGLWIFFFVTIALLSLAKVDALYQMNKPFCWSSLSIALYSGTKMSGQLLIGLLLLKHLQKHISEELIILLASVSQAGSYVMEAFVGTDWQFSLVAVIGILGSTAPAIARGIMSSLAGPHDQGAILSSVAIVEVLCMTSSNFSLLTMYSSTVSTWPGAVYLLMAAFSSVGTCLIIVFMMVSRGENRETP